MSSLVIAGGDVDVVVRDGVVVPGPAPAGTPELDATGCAVVPGFVDLQCNGGFGVDLVAEPERLWELAAALPRTGVTAWLPTIPTSAPEVAERALATLAAGPPGDDVPVATPLGLHLEGPFLSPARRGVHAAELLSPVDPDRAAGWSASAGVALVTLAPELPGALDLVRALTARGVAVAAGHSDATAEEATAAADAGVRLVTHLFNAMAPLHHRAPGLAGVALADPRLHAGVIADGVHLHPTTVVAAWRALGERLVLVTDAVAGPTRRPDGTLAGSDLTMDAAVRNLARFTGCPLSAAVAAATAAPGAVLGRRDVGSLRPGARGDAVLLTPAGEVAATVVGGRVAWRPNG